MLNVTTRKPPPPVTLASTLFARIGGFVGLSWVRFVEATLRGPRFFDSDLALFKNFSLTERAKAQFQFQFYNIFNHVNLANPDGCVDCGSGGKITGIAGNSQLRSLTYGFKLTF